MMHRSGGLPRLTLTRASRLLQTGHTTSEELSLYCHALAVAGEDKWHLNAFTRISNRESLIEQARASDTRRRAGGVSLSPLDGVPVSVKANLAISHEPLTAASRILGCDSLDTPPCGYDADVVQKLLRECGAILVGVTNMDEFGMGSLGTNVAVSSKTGASVTRNPIPYLSLLDLKPPPEDGDDDSKLAEFIRTAPDSISNAHVEAFEQLNDPLWSAGGSSCGSAASVSHGSSLASLGTDTGGSLRLPAAWCGVVALKPSYGRLSRYGLVSYASSLDTVGVIAPTTSCATTVLDALSQPNANSRRDSTASFYDPTLAPFGAADPHWDSGGSEESKQLAGVKIGLPSAFSVAECNPSIHDSWRRAASCLQRYGALIQTISAEVVSPETIQRSLAAYYVLASAEASSNLNRYDGLRYGVCALPGIPYETEDGSVTEMTSLEQQYSETRIRHFGHEVTRRILCGTSVLSSDRFHTHYEAAARLRAVLTQQLHRALTEVDVLLIPTALSLPCPLDEPPDSTEMFANDVMTVPISLAGLPAVSVPIPLSSTYENEMEFVAGLQLVGSRFDEKALLDVAKVIEEAHRP